MFCIFKKKISFCIVSLSYLESRETLSIFNVFVVVCFIVVAFALVLPILCYLRQGGCISGYFANCWS